ncbi:unnamed protein product [Dicrocoelium dendriticum]|nr:unnamed protein product [Dicrocoelium dendriticum]
MVCLERVPKHLVISVGEKVFLSLPGHLSVVSGHCLLTPYEHIGSTTRLDDCTIRELSAFKRQLVEMCKKQLNGSGCVFIENAVRIDSPRSHIQVDCIPVDGDVFDSLPAYFQATLSEIGSEWDQNRRVLRLKPGGMGAHGAVPPKLPYFAVEFGLLGGGLVRVIDDGRDIPSYFGREIIGEVLGKNTHFWRKPKPESFERLCEKVVQFEAWWTPFDNWSQRDPRGRSSAESRVDPVPPHPLTPEGPELPPSLPS